MIKEQRIGLQKCIIKGWSDTEIYPGEWEGFKWQRQNGGVR